jgi:hypothetical protein
MEDVRKMTIHRLTVTVTVIETTTITISQPRESNDEEWIDLTEHIAVGRTRRRSVRRRRDARASAGDDSPAQAGPGGD